MTHYSCFYENFQTLGRLIAHSGVTVVMPDFRNTVAPSQVGESIGFFPSGLNDCCAAVRWVHDQANILNIDQSRVIVAGESGGGNLAVSTTLKLLREKVEKLVSGVYVLCPYLCGKFGTASEHQSNTEHAGIFMDYPDSYPLEVDWYGPPGNDIHSTKNILAFPGYCTVDDLVGFPPCAIVVNEFDPLRDEGIDLYRKLLQAGPSVPIFTELEVTW